MWIELQSVRQALKEWNSLAWPFEGRYIPHKYGSVVSSSDVQNQANRKCKLFAQEALLVLSDWEAKWPQFKFHELRSEISLLKEGKDGERAAEAEDFTCPGSVEICETVRRDEFQALQAELQREKIRNADLQEEVNTLREALQDSIAASERGKDAWDFCWKRMCSPLPPCLRLPEVRDDVLALLQPWEPKSVPWCPKAYRLNADLAVDAKGFYTPELAKAWLTGHQRHESASMLPVLALDIRPEHTVIELCAAPGSKTLQILDVMQAGFAKLALNQTLSHTGL
eukprot:g16043.t1